MLEVQKWLIDNKLNFEKLEEEYGVKSKLYKDRVVLNYCQINSRKYDPIAKECRALILSYPEVTNILSRSFDRFFNYGEDPKTEEFSVFNSHVLIKEDGSLINVYDDGNKLCISSRSMAFAEGETASGHTYEELVLRTKPYLLETLNKKFPTNFIKQMTFIFELCTRENRVVKRYDEDKLFLLSIRNKLTGEFLDDYEVDKIAELCSFDRPEEIFFNNFDSILKSMDNLPPLDEGYVCHDGKGWRIKVKNPSYLAIAHLRDNGVLSPKRISVLVWKNDVDEYLSYFPEDEEFFKPYQSAYKKMMAHIDTLWNQVKTIEDPKEFALKVKDYSISSILFQMKKGKKLNEVFEHINEPLKFKILKSYVSK